MINNTAVLREKYVKDEQRETTNHVNGCAAKKRVYYVIYGIKKFTELFYEIL